MKKEPIILTQDQKTNFQRFLELCDRYKNSFLWGDNGNVRRRNYIEKRDCLDYGTVVNGVEYNVSFSVSMSRSHVYVTKYVYRGGKRTTARVIRTLLEKDESASIT